MKTSSNVIDVHRVATDKEATDSSMSLRYTVDGKYVFTAKTTGSVTVGAEGQRAMHFVTPGEGNDICTCVRVADVPPDAETGSYTTAMTTSDGHISVWNVTPGRRSDMIGFANEKDNELMACAFAPGAPDTVLTGGSDSTLRLYKVGESSLELVQTIDQGINRHGQPTLGPPKKVMAAQFVDRDTVLVGGWESSVLLYDLRSNNVVRTFDGPRLSGDGLDVRDGCVLAASHRPKDQLQVFELSTGKQLTPSVSLDTLPFACRLFGRASKLGAWIAGTSSNSAYAVNLLTGEPMASVEDIPEAVYAIDVNPTDPHKATVGCAGGASYRIVAEI